MTFQIPNSVFYWLIQFRIANLEKIYPARWYQVCRSSGNREISKIAFNKVIINRLRVTMFCQRFLNAFFCLIIYLPVNHLRTYSVHSPLLINPLVVCTSLPLLINPLVVCTSLPLLINPLVVCTSLPLFINPLVVCTSLPLFINPLVVKVVALPNPLPPSSPLSPLTETSAN